MVEKNRTFFLLRLKPMENVLFLSGETVRLAKADVRMVQQERLIKITILVF